MWSQKLSKLGILLLFCLPLACLGGGKSVAAGDKTLGDHSLDESQNTAQTWMGLFNWNMTTKDAIPWALVVMLFGLGVLVVRASHAQSKVMLSLAESQNNDKMLKEVISKFLDAYVEITRLQGTQRGQVPTNQDAHTHRQP